MEKNIKIMCPECDHEETFKIGMSFLDSKYNLLSTKKENCILNRIEEQDKTKVLSIMKHGGELDDGYGYELYYCNNCHYVYNKYSFCIGIGKDKYTSSYTCPVCTMKLEKLDKTKMIDYKCKHCKKESMIYIN